MFKVTRLPVGKNRWSFEVFLLMDFLLNFGYIIILILFFFLLTETSLNFHLIFIYTSTRGILQCYIHLRSESL